MKVDRARLKKFSSEVPAECYQIIEHFQTCTRPELLDELSKIHTWTFGKCELYHWAPVLDIFDIILEEACESEGKNKWMLFCDIHYSAEVSTHDKLIIDNIKVLFTNSYEKF